MELDNNTFLGAREDTRTKEEKEKDIHFNEVVAKADVVDWSKPLGRKFTKRNQGHAGSCVANTIAKQAEIEYSNKNNESVVFSAKPIYDFRSNKPYGGMMGVEAFNIWKKKGITTESIIRSQNVASDKEIDDIPMTHLATDTSLAFRIDGYMQLPLDMETIASTIQKTKKGVMVWFKFTAEEWGREIPKIMGDKEPLFHSVTAVDIAIKDGQKTIYIEDSAPFAGIYERYLTEDWFQKRLYFAGIPRNFKSIAGLELDVPNHKFTKALSFIPLDNLGNISDMYTHNMQLEDVMALQDILKYEKILENTVDSTGYYGAKTCKAVLEFQMKHKVASDEDLIKLGGKRVGPATISILNKLYS
jgi:hypothetical protein